MTVIVLQTTKYVKGKNYSDDAGEKLKHQHISLYKCNDQNSIAVLKTLISRVVWGRCFFLKEKFAHYTLWWLEPTCYLFVFCKLMNSTDPSSNTGCSAIGSWTAQSMRSSLFLWSFKWCRHSIKFYYLTKKEKKTNKLWLWMGLSEWSWQVLHDFPRHSFAQSGDKHTWEISEVVLSLPSRD